MNGAMILCGILLCCCHTDKHNATNVAYEYSYALANYQVDVAEPYATSETKSTTLVKARQVIQSVGEKYIKSDTPAELEITDITFPTDTSAVATYHKKTPIKDFSGTVELRKRDGKWLVHDPIPIIEMPDTITNHVPKAFSKDGKEIHVLQPDENIFNKTEQN